MIAINHQHVSDDGIRSCFSFHLTLDPNVFLTADISTEGLIVYHRGANFCHSFLLDWTTIKWLSPRALVQYVESELTQRRVN
jgi:hypothetical protein